MNTLVSPPSSKSAFGTAATMENALPLCRWQWRQWQIAVSSGVPLKL
jgi:hypothetical protein